MFIRMRGRGVWAVLWAYVVVCSVGVGVVWAVEEQGGPTPTAPTHTHPLHPHPRLENGDDGDDGDDDSDLGDYVSEFGSPSYYPSAPSYADPILLSAVMKQADEANFRYPMATTEPPLTGKQQEGNSKSEGETEGNDIKAYSLFPSQYHQLLPFTSYKNASTFHPLHYYDGPQSPLISKGYANTKIQGHNTKGYNSQSTPFENKSRPTFDMSKEKTVQPSTTTTTQSTTTLTTTTTTQLPPSQPPYTTTSTPSQPPSTYTTPTALSQSPSTYTTSTTKLPPSTYTTSTTQLPPSTYTTSTTQLPPSQPPSLYTTTTTTQLPQLPPTLHTRPNSQGNEIVQTPSHHFSSHLPFRPPLPSPQAPSHPHTRPNPPTYRPSSPPSSRPHPPTLPHSIPPLRYTRRPPTKLTPSSTPTPTRIPTKHTQLNPKPVVGIPTQDPHPDINTSKKTPHNLSQTHDHNTQGPPPQDINPHSEITLTPHPTSNTTVRRKEESNFRPSKLDPFLPPFRPAKPQGFFQQPPPVLSEKPLSSVPSALPLPPHPPTHLPSDLPLPPHPPTHLSSNPGLSPTLFPPPPPKLSPIHPPAPLNAQDPPHLSSPNQHLPPTLLPPPEKPLSLPPPNVPSTSRTSVQERPVLPLSGFAAPPRQPQPPHNPPTPENNLTSEPVLPLSGFAPPPRQPQPPHNPPTPENKLTSDLHLTQNTPVRIQGSNLQPDSGFTLPAEAGNLPQHHHRHKIPPPQPPRRHPVLPQFRPNAPPQKEDFGGNGDPSRVFDTRPAPPRLSRPVPPPPPRPPPRSPSFFDNFNFFSRSPVTRRRGESVQAEASTNNAAPKLATKPGVTHGIRYQLSHGPAPPNAQKVVVLGPFKQPPPGAPIIPVPNTDIAPPPAPAPPPSSPLPPPPPRFPGHKISPPPSSPTPSPLSPSPDTLNRRSNLPYLPNPSSLTTPKKNRKKGSGEGSGEGSVVVYGRPSELPHTSQDTHTTLVGTSYTVGSPQIQQTSMDQVREEELVEEQYPQPLVQPLEDPGSPYLHPKPSPASPYQPPQPSAQPLPPSNSLEIKDEVTDEDKEAIIAAKLIFPASVDRVGAAGRPIVPIPVPMFTRGGQKTPPRTHFREREQLRRRTQGRPERTHPLRRRTQQRPPPRTQPGEQQRTQLQKRTQISSERTHISTEQQIEKQKQQNAKPQTQKSALSSFWSLFGFGDTEPEIKPDTDPSPADKEPREKEREPPLRPHPRPLSRPFPLPPLPPSIPSKQLPSLNSRHSEVIRIAHNNIPRTPPIIPTSPYPTTTTTTPTTPTPPPTTSKTTTTTTPLPTTKIIDLRPVYKPTTTTTNKQLQSTSTTTTAEPISSTATTTTTTTTANQETTSPTTTTTTTTAGQEPKLSTTTTTTTDKGLPSPTTTANQKPPSSTTITDQNLPSSTTPTTITDQKLSSTTTTTTTTDQEPPSSTTTTITTTTVTPPIVITRLSARNIHHTFPLVYKETTQIHRDIIPFEPSDRDQESNFKAPVIDPSSYKGWKVVGAPPTPKEGLGAQLSPIRSYVRENTPEIIIRPTTEGLKGGEGEGGRGGEKDAIGEERNGRGEEKRREGTKKTEEEEEEEERRRREKQGGEGEVVTGKIQRRHPSNSGSLVQFSSKLNIETPGVVRSYWVPPPVLA